MRRCHDGVDVHAPKHTNAQVLKAAVDVTRFKLTIKPYEPWEPLAREMYPKEHWDMISSVPTSVYLQVLLKAQECGDVGVEYNRHSLVYRELVEACMYGSVVRVGGELEFFDGGRWKETSDLPYTVQQVLNSIFAVVKRGEEGYTLDCHNPPASDGNFVKMVARLMEDFAKPRRLAALDDDTEMRLLFADGVLWDFAEHGPRASRPEERLFRHCDHPFPTATLHPELRTRAAHATALLHSFYLEGGKTLAVSEDEEEEPEEEQEAKLTAQARAIALALQGLVDVSPVFAHSFETLGTWDDAVFWQRVESRMLSGRGGFAQAYALTGPMGCGKSKLLMRVPMVLGQGYENLGATLPQAYLTVEDKRGGNDSMPTTNKLKGARHVTCKEVSGGKGVLPHLIKGILDQTDVPVDARANNSSAKAVSSFPVTWTLAWAQNAELSFSAGRDAAVADKIVELRPPFIFVSEPRPGTTERRARACMKDLKFYKQPAWILELVVLADIFDKLNDTDLCPDRKLEPLPPLALRIVEGWQDSQEFDDLMKCVAAGLEACTRKDASTADAVLKHLREATGAGGSLLTHAGFGTAARSMRRVGGVNGVGSVRVDIFVLALPGTIEVTPVRIKL